MWLGNFVLNTAHAISVNVQLWVCSSIGTVRYMQYKHKYTRELTLKNKSISTELVNPLNVRKCY